jgi:hypothetical protein
MSVTSKRRGVVIYKFTDPPIRIDIGTSKLLLGCFGFDLLGVFVGISLIEPRWLFLTNPF